MVSKARPMFTRKTNSSSGKLTVFAFHPYLTDPRVFSFYLSYFRCAFSFFFSFLACVFSFFFFFFFLFLLRIMPLDSPTSPNQTCRERNAIPERRNTAISLMIEQRPFQLTSALRVWHWTRLYAFIMYLRSSFRQHEKNYLGLR